MARIFREICEEALLSDGEFSIKRENRYFGKISVTLSEGKKNGHTYMTVCTKEDLFRNFEAKKRISEEVRRCFSYYFKKIKISEKAKILVVGLGNEKITADSLGCQVTDRLLVTSHIFHDEGISMHYGNLCAVKCGVSGCTGVESFDLVFGLIKQIKPDMVIAVDTLSCASVKRLGCTVQLSDGGIEPGGGAGNPKKALTFDTLKIPVLAVGVPLVMYATRIIAEYSDGKSRTDEKVSGLIVAARETDFICRDYADVIADAINVALHGKSFL